jgi:hypothetical protein
MDHATAKGLIVTHLDKPLFDLYETSRAADVSEGTIRNWIRPERKVVSIDKTSGSRHWLFCANDVICITAVARLSPALDLDSASRIARKIVQRAIDRANRGTWEEPSPPTHLCVSLRSPSQVSETIADMDIITPGWPYLVIPQDALINDAIARMVVLFAASKALMTMGRFGL